MPLDDLFVEMTPGVDPHAFGLTRQEAFVLTRALLGRQRLDDLVRLTGLPVEDARTLIRSLVDKGVLRQEGGAVPSAAPPPAGLVSPEPQAPARVASAAPTVAPIAGQSSPRPATVGTAKHALPPGFVLSRDAMAEVCDLSAEQKARVLLLDWLSEHRSHYAFLELDIHAQVADIKKAFFRLSRELHPDTFFRKQLGTFKPRLERVFRASKEAYEVLSDATRREAYDASLGQERCSPEEWRVLSERAAARRAGAQAEEARRARDERAAERLRAQRLARNPMLQRVQKAREWMQLAEQAVTEGKLEHAVRHATMAREYAPADRALVARADEIAGLLGARQASQLLRRARLLLEREEQAVVPALVEDAVARAAHDPASLMEAARILRAGGHTPRALVLAQEATVRAPADPASWHLLADTAELAARWDIALPAATRALELAPDDRDANTRLKRIRKAAR